MAALVKRETGVSPVRSRRCENGMLTKCHWNIREGCKRVDVKSEDLPKKCVHSNHEELVRYKAYYFYALPYPFALNYRQKDFLF